MSDCVKVLPKDFPIDLVGAIDTISLTKITTPAPLLDELLQKGNKNWKAPLESLYYMLNHEEFKTYTDTILKSTNIKIRDTVAGRAILWKDTEMAKKALKKGVSKPIEAKLRAANLI